MKGNLIITIAIAIMLVVAGCQKEGCTDPNAINYDSKAKKDNGTCVYPSSSTQIMVTFDANGGVGTMPPQTFADGVAQLLADNVFTWENHEFIGWNTAADGTGNPYSNAQEMTLEASITLYAQWMAASGALEGHYFVDLGLPSGTMWATCNIGALNPIDGGDYFAWGETQAKENYTLANYKYYDGTDFTKYSFTTIQILDSDDDAAAVNWSAGWHMPTSSDFAELNNNCTHTWTTINGVTGMKVTGPNGNCIFLPAIGELRDDNPSGYGLSGYYWLCELAQTMDFDASEAIHFVFKPTNEFHTNRYVYRYEGLPVRPVFVR